MREHLYRSWHSSCDDGSTMGIRTERGYYYAIANRFSLLIQSITTNVCLAPQSEADVTGAIGGCGYCGLLAFGWRRYCGAGCSGRKSEQLRQSLKQALL